MPDNPLDEEDLILDDCIQKLLNMKDNERLDMTGLQLVVLEMIDELEENRRKNIEPSPDIVNSDDEIRPIQKE